MIISSDYFGLRKKSLTNYYALDDRIYCRSPSEDANFDQGSTRMIFHTRINREDVFDYNRKFAIQDYTFATYLFHAYTFPGSLRDVLMTSLKHY